MYTLFSLFIAGIVLAAAGTAFAGEPTGRYKGAEGSAPVGAEQVYADDSAVGGGYVTSTFADGIPAAEKTSNVAVSVRNLGRSIVLTTNPVPSSTQLANQQ